MIAVIVVPLLAAWGISVGHRCISVQAQGLLRMMTLVLSAILVACALARGIFFASSLLIVLATVLIVEVLLATNVIPSARRFRTLFQYLPLDLRIVAPGGREVYRTNVARVLDGTTLLRLSRACSRKPGSPAESRTGGADGKPSCTTVVGGPRTGDATTREDGAVAGAMQAHAAAVAGSAASAVGGTRAGNAASASASMSFDEFPDTVFKAYPLQAGVAVLAEDVSELRALRSRYEEQRDRLLRQNEALRRQGALRTLLYRQQRERELAERVELDLAATARQIRTILDHRLPEGTPLAEEERKRQLSLVKVLVAYSKRKGMLALAGAESGQMQAAQLEAIARETMADLQSIDIECAILVAAGGPIAMPAVNAVYDSFYDCVLSVLPHAHPVIMVYIAQAGDSSLELRANIECAIGLEGRDNAADLIPRLATSAEPWEAVQMRIAHDLEGRLALRSAEHTVSMDEGLVSVVVKAPAGDETAEQGGVRVSTGRTRARGADGRGRARGGGVL